ncbi:IS630 family transposase [Sorangium sp. So ce134]
MRPYSLDLRQRIVDAYRRGEGSVRGLAERFDVAANTVENYLRLLRTTGSVRPRPHGGGVPPVIGPEGLQTVRALLEEQNDRTLEELSELYAARHGQQVSRTTMSLALRRLGWSRKKKDLRASEQDRPDVRRTREEFAERMSEVAPERLVFLDEFGSHLGMSRGYGWAPWGERAYGAAPCNTDPNVTLVVGLGLRGVVAPLAFEGAMNGPVFEQYLRVQLAPQLRPGDIVLVDGLGAHRTPGARQAVEERGAHYQILPPYSPDLSPVENCGAKIKQFIRAQAPRTVPALYEAIGQALRKVTRQDARGWFGRVGYVPKRPARVRLRPGDRYFARRPPRLPLLDARQAAHPPPVAVYQTRP